MWLIHWPWFCCQALFYYLLQEPLEEKVLTIWHLWHCKIFLVCVPKHFILSSLKSNSEEQDACCSLWNFPIKGEYVKCHMCSLERIKIIGITGEITVESFCYHSIYQKFLFIYISKMLLPFPNPTLISKF